MALNPETGPLIAQAIEQREQEKLELTKKIYTFLFDWQAHPSVFYSDPHDELKASTQYETDRENMDAIAREKHEEHLHNKLRNRWLSNFYDIMENVLYGGYLRDNTKEAWGDIQYIEDQFDALRERKERDEFICGIDSAHKIKKDLRDPQEKGITYDGLELLSPYLKTLRGKDGKETERYTQYAQELLQEMRRESIIRAFPELEGRTQDVVEEIYQQELSTLVIPGTKINNNQRYLGGIEEEFKGADWQLQYVLRGLNPEFNSIDDEIFKQLVAKKIGREEELVQI